MCKMQIDQGSTSFWILKMTPTTYKPIFIIYVVHIKNVRTMLLEVKKKSKGGQGGSGKGEYRSNCDLKKTGSKAEVKPSTFLFILLEIKNTFQFLPSS